MKNLKNALVIVLALVLSFGALVSCNGNGGAQKLASPEIRLEKGEGVTVAWEAVEGAISYIATVNGEQMPAQTACSLVLTEDKEYTVSVRALASDAAYHSDASNILKVSYGFNEEAVVLRFAAVSDLHVASTLKSNKVRDMMRRTIEKYELDAFLFAGDLVNAQTTDKYSAVPGMALFASGVAAGNAEAQLPLIWCFGNHDFPTYTLQSPQTFTSASLGKYYAFSAGTLVYDACTQILEDATPAFFSLDAWPNPSLAVPDGFRYNLVNDFSFFAVDYTHVNADTLAFLKAQLDALVAKEPEKQIFVLSHMPQGSGSQPAGFTDLMKQYPQIVYLSGHSHDTLQTYSAVVAGESFLELNLGPGDHAQYGISGPGHSYNNYQMKQGAVIEVDENGRMRFTGIDYSLNEEEDGSFTSTLDKEVVVAENPMEIRKAYFAPPTATVPSTVLYDSVVNNKNDARYHAPAFPETPTAAFDTMTADGGTVTFSAADAANVIMYYHVTVKDKTTGELVSIYDKQAKGYTTALKTPANHIYYPSGAHMPDTVTLSLKFESDADLSHEYVLYVSGVDDFGVASAECAFDFTLD